MAVTFELPREIETALRRSLGDLDQTAKEAALIELYRQGEVTPRELSEALGISRLERDALLKKHNVTEDLMPVETYESNLSRHRKTIG